MAQKGSGIFNLLGVDSVLRSNKRPNTEFDYSLNKRKNNRRKDLRERMKQNKSKQRINNSLVNINTARTSESKLIHKYEDYKDATADLTDAYTDHLRNLITLDDKFGMDGLKHTFKKYLMTTEFKNDEIDKSNPLFLRNYLITNKSLPSDVRKEHLMSQITYLLTKFNYNDQMLIKGFNVESLNKNEKSILIKFRCIDNESYEKSVKVNKQYLIDLLKLKEILINIIKTVKKNTGYEKLKKNDDFIYKSSTSIKIPGFTNSKSKSKAINNLFKSNKSKKKSKKSKSKSKSNELKMNASSIGLSSKNVIPLSQLNSDSSSKSSKKSSNNTEKKAQVKLFSVSSRKSKSKGKSRSGSNGTVLSQGFRRLDPKKPLDIDKGLDELIKGIDLSKNSKFNNSDSRDRRSRNRQDFAIANDGPVRAHRFVIS